MNVFFKHIPDLFFIRLMYIFKFNKIFKLSKCETFSDLIQKRKLLSYDERFSIYSDKLRAKDIVKEICPECIVPELYGKYESIKNICLESLPESFVLKTNHDSGSCFIVKDKKNYDFTHCFKVLEKSLNFDYGEFSKQRHYSEIKPYIICEEILPTSDLIDYKVHCFHGRPKYIQVAYNEMNNIFTTDWCDTNVSYLNKRNLDGYSKPKALSSLIEISRELSKNFDYVRVDLYIIEEKVYFGEFTFTPNNGYAKFMPLSFEKDLYRLWVN
ncbi:hypothetical protein BCV34_21540 [Vibrio lentus]|uniref:Uncharacterized protein n=1 Tax=Vibrio lentus TaxID=136468 RepID=A0A2N7C6G9_9VIBR|nr:hypothetical protein BCV34_21540 [Vibrio lentus]PME72260.1 hypothetical protein BCV30_21865 [Vibrio lentus]